MPEGLHIDVKARGGCHRADTVAIGVGCKGCDVGAVPSFAWPGAPETHLSASGQ